jgi:hypothetical protein
LLPPPAGHDRRGGKDADLDAGPATYGPTVGLADTLRYASDANTQGSGGDLDYHILIPEDFFGATGCCYNPAADWGVYLILWNRMGDVGGDWVVGSTYEEFGALVQDYASPPSGNPSPGLFDWKVLASGTSHTITLPLNDHYGVHAVVAEAY